MRDPLIRKIQRLSYLKLLVLCLLGVQFFLTASISLAHLIFGPGHVLIELLGALPFSLITSLAMTHTLIALRQAEQASLTESMSLKEIVDSSAVATFVLDADHTVRYWNKACEELTGQPAARMIGTKDQWKAFYPHQRQTLADVILEGNFHDLPNLYKKVTASVLNKRGLHGEGRFKELNGKDRDIIFDAAPILAPDGTIRLVVETLQDVTEQREMAENLKQANEMLQGMIQASPVAVVSFDRDGKVGVWNTAAQSIFGWSEQEVRGSFNPIIEGDQQAEFLDLFGRVLGGERLSRVEVRRRRKDGSQVEVSVSSAPIRNARNEAVGIISMIEDITEHKRSESALRESEQRYRSLIDAANDAILVADVESGRIVEANKKAEELFGRPAGELIGLHQAELHPQGEQEKYRKSFAESVQQGKGVSTGDLFIANSRGEKVPVEISVNQFESAGRRMIIGLFRDITERRRQEEELQRARDFAESLIRTANVMVVVLDREGRLLQLNEAGEAIIGYRQEELLGRPWFETVVPAERYPAAWTEFERLSASEEYTGRMTSPVLTRTGDERIVSWQNSSLTTGRGAVIVFFGIDITEQKRAEDLLLDSLHQKETLLREVHHRVKNNLQIIASLLYLQSEEIRDLQTRALLQESRDRIKSMAIVHEKLYRTSDAGAVDLGGYLHSLTSYLFHSYSAEARGLTLELRADTILLAIDLAVPCGLIVNELVSNALKHAFAGRHQGTVSVSASAEGATVRIAVADNGIGTTEPGTARAGSLGMRLVDNLARQLRGTLAVETGGGTTVTLRFPAGMKGARG